MDRTAENKRRIEEYNRHHAHDTAFMVRDDWDESKHPRAKNGQFGSGGGSAAKAAPKAKAAAPKAAAPAAPAKKSSSTGGKFVENPSGGYYAEADNGKAAFVLKGANGDWELSLYDTNKRSNSEVGEKQYFGSKEGAMAAAQRHMTKKTRPYDGSGAPPWGDNPSKAESWIDSKANGESLPDSVYSVVPMYAEMLRSYQNGKEKEYAEPAKTLNYMANKMPVGDLEKVSSFIYKNFYPCDPLIDFEAILKKRK